MSTTDPFLRNVESSHQKKGSQPRSDDYNNKNHFPPVINYWFLPSILEL